jgi:hypothetical protein
MRSRLLMTMARIVSATWSETSKAILKLNVNHARSFRCWFVGHEDGVRGTPGRLYLECVECGRQTPGWRTESGYRGHANKTAATTEIANDQDRSASAPVRSVIKRPVPPERRIDSHRHIVTRAA